MRRQILWPSRTDKGFTLIELLVVIVIVGILAAIAIPNLLDQRKKAYDSSAKADARTIATQLESYYTEALTYPANAQYSFAAPTVVLGDETAQMSPGNVPTVHVGGDVFCVEVLNPGKASRRWVWQSDNGGLQTDAAASCSSYGTALS